jgi:hypothetical protein
MFRWYENEDKCYVYLSDVSKSGHATNVPSSSTTWEAAFQKSRWFSRGWTLQELIAPASVEFFSSEADWLGNNISLEQQIYEITGIAIEALRGGPLMVFEAEERFSWAKHRDWKRQENKAYSLFGIFNVHMPHLYGEGRENAFIRLREEIGKSSKCKWHSTSPLTTGTPLRPAPVEQPETPPSSSSSSMGAFLSRRQFLSTVGRYMIIGLYWNRSNNGVELRRQESRFVGIGGAG